MAVPTSFLLDQGAGLWSSASKNARLKTAVSASFLLDQSAGLWSSASKDG
jgi:hypothetical protein